HSRPKQAKPKEQKMKSLEFFEPPCRRKDLNLARRIAIPLLLLTAGMVVMHARTGGMGTWEETGSLATGRSDHTATLLPDGQVLVAGGGDSDLLTLASAEL